MTAVSPQADQAFAAIPSKERKQVGGLQSFAAAATARFGGGKTDSARQYDPDSDAAPRIEVGNVEKADFANSGRLSRMDVREVVIQARPAA